VTGHPTIGLVMIVRDEAAVLPRLAASVAPQVDRWTIVDTGSRDGTPDLARELVASVPGELVEDEWRGYGASRNVALQAAESHTDWLFTIDADETLHGDLAGSPFAEATDGILAEQRVGWLSYWLPRLVRSGIGWRWWGRAHEYLQLGSGTGSVTATAAFWVEHHADGGNRATKFERELGLLRQDWDDQPGDPRTAFNLARTQEGLGRIDDAIHWYRQRLDLGGWAEESFFARLSLGSCLLRSGHADEGCGALWRAWGERPWRAEPLVALAGHYRDSGAWELAFEAASLAFDHCGARPDGPPTGRAPDVLFVDRAATEWQAAYEASISAWYVGEHDRGRELNAYLLERADVAAEIRAAVEANLTFFEEG
jgi:glycosyltransferase involved in cell wall biosynthesis